MKIFVDVPTVYLCTNAVDFRKSINGLAALAEAELELPVLNCSLFVFCNKGRDKFKPLYWDKTGFVLWYKRLDKQKFKWPQNIAPTMSLSEHQLHWLLSGYDVTGHSEIDVTRQKPTRKPLPKDLPREQIIHDIENKSGDCCGGALHKMGEGKSEKLEFIPAVIKVTEHIRPKCACRHCEKSSTHTSIKQAAMPAMPINKGMATASLLSHLITSKYQYGIELSRQTMSSWIIKSATFFAPLMERLKA